ncbi:hypothetical protein Tco_0959880 [Tanacetum coccineum]
MAARGQNQGKEKNKIAYAPKPKIPPPPKREDPAKDSIYHECGETGHWKRKLRVSDVFSEFADRRIKENSLLDCWLVVRALKNAFYCMSGKMARKPYTHRVEGKAPKTYLTIPYRLYVAPGFPKETWRIIIFSPRENKVLVARNAEFLKNSLINQEASGSLEDLEIDEPQSDITPIRRSTRTRRLTDRMCLYIDAEEHELGDLGEPAKYKAALLDPESDK